MRLSCLVLDSSVIAYMYGYYNHNYLSPHFCCCVSEEDSSTAAAALPASTQEAQPPKSKKPRVLELPSSPSALPPGLTLDKVSAAVNSLLAPGSTTNTLTPTVITSHALVSISLTHTRNLWDTLQKPLVSPNRKFGPQ